MELGKCAMELVTKVNTLKINSTIKESELNVHIPAQAHQQLSRALLVRESSVLELILEEGNHVQGTEGGITTLITLLETMLLESMI